MDKIDRSVIESAMDYSTYRDLINRLLAEGKTTGPNQSEAMLQYTELNNSRMDRLDKRARLTEGALQRLQQLERPMIWLTLTEAWCGDAAQISPVLAKMAAQSENIQLKFLLRDENLSIMDAFLTNGGRSIPKVIALDGETLEVLGSWGPRPQEAQRLTVAAKAEREKIEDKETRKAMAQEAAKELHRWYAKDKTQSIQEELLNTIFADTQESAA